MFIALDSLSTREGSILPSQANGKSPIHSFYLFTFTVMQLIAQSQSPVFLAACLMTEDAVVFIKPAYAPFIFSLETHFYRQS